LNTLLILSAVGNEGKKGVIMIIHHTDCGLAHITDSEIATSLKNSVKSEAEKAVLDDMIFGSFEE